MDKPKINLRSFRKLAIRNKKRFRNFIGRLEKSKAKNLQLITLEANELAWAETDCLTCANCCKTMTPTFTPKDISRIAAHLNMTRKAFREKWLYKDRSGDWINKKQPCQFLDLKTNFCGIYEVRPDDCAGFPHHSTKKITEYGHVFKQNVEFCPATYRLVEFMQAGLADGKWELERGRD